MWHKWAWHKSLPPQLQSTEACRPLLKRGGRNPKLFHLLYLIFHDAFEWRKNCILYQTSRKAGRVNFNNDFHSREMNNSVFMLISERNVENSNNRSIGNHGVCCNTQNAPGRNHDRLFSRYCFFLLFFVQMAYLNIRSPNSYVHYQTASSLPSSPCIYEFEVFVRMDRRKQLCIFNVWLVTNGTFLKIFCCCFFLYFFNKIYTIN